MKSSRQKHSAIELFLALVNRIKEFTVCKNQEQSSFFPALQLTRKRGELQGSSCDPYIMGKTPKTSGIKGCLHQALAAGPFPIESCDEACPPVLFCLFLMVLSTFNCPEAQLHIQQAIKLLGHILQASFVLCMIRHNPA